MSWWRYGFNEVNDWALDWSGPTLFFKKFTPLVHSSAVNWTTAYNELLIPSRNLCSVENDKAKFLVLYLVHTKPSHLERRQLIRSSWGQAKDSNGFISRVVFVMGKEERAKQRKSMRNPKLALLPPKKYAVSCCYYERKSWHSSEIGCLCST